MTKNLRLLSVIFLLFAKTWGQDIFIIPYKKGVYIEEKELGPNNKYAIEANKNLFIPANSKLIIFNQSSYVENITGSYSYQQLKSVLVKKLPNALRHHLMTTHKLTIANNYTDGTKVAGVKAGVKGLNGNNKAKLKELNEYAIPADSSQIASQTVELNWKIAEKVNAPHLTITHVPSGQTIVDKAIEKSGSLVVTLDQAGEYEYEITSSFDKKIVTTNTFFKLTEQDREKALLDHEDFKKSISDLDNELQTVLLEEYLDFHLLIIN